MIETESIRIQPATLADLKTVKHIDETLFGADTYPMFVLRQLYDITAGLLKVAVVENQVVGYAIAHLDHETGNAWFLSLGVLPNFRGRGIGELLTKTLLQEVSTKGANKALLTVHPDNQAGISIYKRLGFKEKSTTPDYYLDNTPRIVMAADLKV